MPMNSIRNILFDLDGTLVDSPIDFAGIRKALGISRQQDILGYVGSLQSSDEELYAKACDIVYQFEFEASQHAIIYEGVEELLKFLTKQNIQLGIVTRNCREIAHEQIKSIEKYFLKVLTRDDVENPKPHPESFEFFRDHYAFSSNETLFIGNHYHDEQFAQNNNLMYLQYVPAEKNTRDHFEFDSYLILLEKYLEIQPKEFK